jgi:hypothetical protein
VPFGKKNAFHASTSKPLRPCSSAEARSGSAALRRNDRIASGFTVRAWIGGIAVEMMSQR